MDSLSDIQDRLDYRFQDPNLLKRALTHKSYANERPKTEHNERLEFLGDAVLNLIVSEILVRTHPDSNEGDLSRLRAAIVSESALASIGRQIALGDHLLLGKGEEQTGGREKDSLLANSLEAVIAAIYLDAGYASAAVPVSRLFADMIRSAGSVRGSSDFKTELQELCQERLRQLPEYRIVSQTGPDHQKIFSVELIIKGKVYGRGTGKSKKEAEQRAAKEAIERLAPPAAS